MTSNFLYMHIKPILRKLIQYLERPLVIAGRFAGSFFVSYFRSQLFFFFPFYHIGGAEKVHARITGCVKEHKPIVFFADKSKSSALKKQFIQSARVFDLGYFNNPVLIYFWAGVLSTIVNSNRNCVVFGCNNILFYKLIPYLNPQIYCIDLIHAFGGGIENVSLPYVDRLDKRIVINTRTLKDLKKQYSLNGVPENLNDRIFLIENCVQIPELTRRKDNKKDNGPKGKNNGPKGKNNGLKGKNSGSILRILYVGRGSEEKRVHLIGEISHLCHQKGMTVEFLLVGDIKNSMPIEYCKCCNFLGEIVDEKKLSEIYKSSDILLLVSKYEGFPLVIMEAMAYGVVPISTDVGGISEHIRNRYNGFLIKNENEDRIVKNVCKVIGELISNKNLMDKISFEAYEYAKANFNCEKFCSKYKELILSE